MQIWILIKRHAQILTKTHPRDMCSNFRFGLGPCEYHQNIESQASRYGNYGPCQITRESWSHSNTHGLKSDFQGGFGCEHRAKSKRLKWGPCTIENSSNGVHKDVTQDDNIRGHLWRVSRHSRNSHKPIWRLSIWSAVCLLHAASCKWAWLKVLWSLNAKVSYYWKLCSFDSGWVIIWVLK